MIVCVCVCVCVCSGERGWGGRGGRKILCYRMTHAEGQPGLMGPDMGEIGEGA